MGSVSLSFLTAEIVGMVAARKSRTKRKSRRSKSFSAAVLGRPTGVIQHRVQNVGPERFGIVAVDCAKVRSKWMLADFFGNVIVEPVVVEHNKAGFGVALATLKEAVRKRQLEDEGIKRCQEPLIAFSWHTWYAFGHGTPKSSLQGRHDLSRSQPSECSDDDL